MSMFQKLSKGMLTKTRLKLKTGFHSLTASYVVGSSLFFKNSFTTNWVTFFENYLHMTLKTEILFFIGYKLAKLD